MNRLHRFVVVYVDGGSCERWFDDVRSAFEFKMHFARSDVFVQLEETGSRYRVLRP